MDTTMPEIAESDPEIRPRQPESEPGSEPADRNVRPRLAPDQEVTQLDEMENSQSTSQTRRNLDQTPDEVPVENLSGAASSTSFVAVGTEFDSKNKTRRPLKQSKEWLCSIARHNLSGCHPDRKTRVVWCMMSCVGYGQEKNRRI